MPVNLTQLSQYIEEQIAKISLNPTTQADSLYKPIEYILNLDGKRMRPILTLLGCILFEDHYQKAIHAALATEVFHNFTLLHDDIMDRAPLRRNQLTVHEKWNTSTAILSGDAMLIKAYELLALTPSKHLSHLLALFNRCALEVCEGQQLDMEFESKGQVSQQEYLEMIRLKTAVLPGFCLEAGAIIGGAEPAESALLRQFGVYIGLGFQLKDDFLDVYGSQEKFGKQVGGDIIVNKKTFLLIRALEKAQDKQKKLLKNWLDKKKFNKKEKVSAITTIYNELNIKQELEKKINKYFDRSSTLLNKLEIAEQKKKYLVNFTKNLLRREK